MTGDDAPPDVEALLRAAMDQVDATIRPILSAADELRQKATALGFDNEAASAMGAELFKSILRKAIKA